MPTRNFLGNPPIPDADVSSNIVFPVVDGSGVDARLSLEQIVTYTKLFISLYALAPDGQWLKTFLAAGYNGDQPDARAALGAEAAGAADALINPLVASLNAVAFSGALADLSMPELQEQMLLAATPAEVRTAIGAAASGGSGFAWRNVTGVADSDTIVVANTDTGVVIIDGGFSRLYFDMPEGVEDGQEVVIVVTGSIDVVIWLGAGTVIQNHPHFNENGGAGYKLKWIDAASSWIVLG